MWDTWFTMHDIIYFVISLHSMCSKAGPDYAFIFPVTLIMDLEVVIVQYLN